MCHGLPNSAGKNTTTSCAFFRDAAVEWRQSKREGNTYIQKIASVRDWKEHNEKMEGPLSEHSE